MGGSRAGRIRRVAAAAFGVQHRVYFEGRTEDLLDVVGTNGREIRTGGVARAVGSHRQPDSHA
jgi:hypothetical protein